MLIRCTKRVRVVHLQERGWWCEVGQTNKIYEKEMWTDRTVELLKVS